MPHMTSPQPPRHSFRREFFSVLGTEVVTAVIRLILVLVPPAAGYALAGFSGLLAGAVIGVVLLGVFWIVVVVFAAAGAGAVLKGHR